MNEIKRAIDELKQQFRNSEDCVVNGTTIEMAISALEKQIELKEKLKEYKDGYINVYELLEELKILVDWSVEE